MALAENHSRGPLDRFARLVEGTAGRFHRCQFTDAVRVLLHGKIEDAIGGVEVGALPSSICHTLGSHVSDNGGEDARVLGLWGSRPTRHVVYLDPGFPESPQIEVVLQSLAQEFTPQRLETAFHVGVGERLRFLSSQPRHHLLAPFAGTTEHLYRPVDDGQ